MPTEVTFPNALDTERLILRRYASTDAPAILKLVTEHRDRLIRNFSPMAKGFSNEEEAIAFTEDKNSQWNALKAFCYGIWRKASMEQIGQLQVKNVLWDVPSAELSYFVASSSLGQGFDSTMLRVTFQQLAFERIFVRIIPSNQESLSLANKLGFQHEGLHRKEFRCGFGELHDVHYFSLTTQDYKRANRRSVDPT